MPGTQLDQSTDVLTDLDFVPQCEHSQHQTDQRCHGGDATHLCMIVHRCIHPNGESPFYLGCEPWVKFLNSARPYVLCARCHTRMRVEDFAVVVRKL